MITDYKFVKCPYCGRIIIANTKDKKYSYKGRDVILTKHDGCIGYKTGYFIAELVNNVDFESLTNSSLVESTFLEKYVTDIYEEVIKNLDQVSPGISSVMMSCKVYGDLVDKYKIDEYDSNWAEKVDIVIDYFYQYFKKEQFFTEKMNPIKLLWLKSK